MTAEEHDGGLQHERTALAWDRTGLALVVTALLLVRAAGPPYTSELSMAGYGSALVGAVLIAHARRRYGKRVASGDSVAAPGFARLTGAVVTLLGTAAFLVLLLR